MTTEEFQRRSNDGARRMRQAVRRGRFSYHVWDICFAPTWHRIQDAWEVLRGRKVAIDPIPRILQDALTPFSPDLVKLAQDIDINELEFMTWRKDPSIREPDGIPTRMSNEQG